MLSNKPKQKVKRELRVRNEDVAVCKKSRLEPVKSEGANAELRKDIQVKAETIALISLTLCSSK